MMSPYNPGVPWNTTPGPSPVNSREYVSPSGPRRFPIPPPPPPLRLASDPHLPVQYQTAAVPPNIAPAQLAFPALHSLPSSLIPGSQGGISSPASIDTPDLFFYSRQDLQSLSSRRLSMILQPPPVPPPPALPVQRPPLHKAVGPPLPPKIPLLSPSPPSAQQVIPMKILDSTPQPSTPLSVLRPYKEIDGRGNAEDQDLAKTLAFSSIEVYAASEVSTKEEDQINKAIKSSILPEASMSPVTTGMSHVQADALPALPPKPSLSPIYRTPSRSLVNPSPTAEVEVANDKQRPSISLSPMPSPSLSTHIRLEQSVPPPLSVPVASLTPPSSASSFLSADSANDRALRSRRSLLEPSRLEQIVEDEALARQLAEEEESSAKPGSGGSNGVLPSEPSLYNRAISRAIHPQSPVIPSNSPILSTVEVGRPMSTRSLSSSSLGTSYDSAWSNRSDLHPPAQGTVSVTPSPPSSAVDLHARSAPFSLAEALRSRSSSIVGQDSNAPLSEKSEARVLSHASSSSTSVASNGSPDPSRYTSDQSQPFLPVNQYIEPNLLYGISLGFQVPTMTSELTMMQGPMPNIISLPYGRCPPLHLHAPNWRQLLTLLARLSGTRIEASVEALASVKTEMTLRTVVQFVKVHQSSAEWRTVLWLTIDCPVPDGAPPRFKQNMNDTTALPYSYSLTAVPTLLRMGPDSPTAKAYTVPSTANTPHPKLPISCPTLAMYLQSALDDSRRLAGESSTGIRRLAKLVDTLYPSDDPVKMGDPVERRTVGGIIRKVGKAIRRSSVPTRGGNEDTYQYVTPFVPDEQEWG